MLLMKTRLLLQGGLSINYSDNYYLLSQRHPDVPRLTQQHHEAMALFNEIASSDALRLDSMLQPGDIQLLNNHTQLHTRSKFEDFPVSTCSDHSTIAGLLCANTCYGIRLGCTPDGTALNSICVACMALLMQSCCSKLQHAVYSLYLYPPSHCWPPWINCKVSPTLCVDECSVEVRSASIA